MARWSIFKDGSAVHNVEIAQTCKNNGFCFDLDSRVKGVDDDDCKGRLRNLFDQVLTVFLGEVSEKKYIRPIPALLGDGRPADLFKLFWVVRKKGGYDAVSNNGLWAFVAEECGLGVGVMASVKLIYTKYLSELDQWLKKVFRDKSLGNGEIGVIEKLDLLSLELEEFRGSLPDVQDKKNKYGKLVELEYDNNDLDIDKSELHLSPRGNINKVHDNAERSICDDDENFYVQGDNIIGFSAKSVVDKVLNCRKRKRQFFSLSEMLNWVTQAAKNSDDPAIGIIPECSKWKEHGSEALWVQTLLAREALLTRRHVDFDTEESLLQKKLRMHPSMYEDNDIHSHQSAEGLRCSKRIPTAKSQSCPCCGSCSTTQSKTVSPRKAEVENILKKPAPVTVEKLIPNATDDMSKDEPLQKQVCVGPLFQAEVPAWTGVVSESDSKWLGTRMWPPEDGKNKSSIEMDSLGEGRPHSCDCRLPGSTECVRFHIAEKRMKLKLELGLLFYRWRFDGMGEEVSLSWTIEEENRFKHMVRLNPTFPNKFWNNGFKFFRTKTREKLVSYYFNVLLVRRRSYQNRVTPNNIDSDDDETEFGSVGDSFGHEAIHVPGSKLLICSQNTQCTDLE